MYRILWLGLSLFLRTCPWPVTFTSVSELLFLPLCDTGWRERVGAPYLPSPRLGMLCNSFPEDGPLLGRTGCAGSFPNGSFLPPFARSTGGFFSSPDPEHLVGLLE